jgi:phenylalanyl-tRNA synthetase beta chain
MLGTRPVSNVVDATNWVMLELGHPLHAFDLGRLAGQGKQKKVIVRRAAATEVMKTLDGVERQLKEEDLVIADAQKPIALAGIMGGEDTEIVNASGDVLVESAYFESQVVYKTSKRLGLQTEASSRFWRGTDIDGVAFANDRTCQLLSEWAEGKVCRGTVDVYPRRRPALEVSVRPKRLAEYLGVTVSAEEIAKYLTALDLQVKSRTDQAITFGIPTFRVDLTMEVDLIEEVARLHGYEKIPERLPEAGGAYDALIQQDKGHDLRRVRDLLASQGLSEATNYSFVGGAEEAAFRPASIDGPVKLQNPMTEDQSVMRTSLITGLVKNARHNLAHQVYDVRLFEIGRVYHPRSGDLTGLSPRDAMLPVEHERLAILLHGPASPFGWGMPKREVDFFDIKRITEAIFDAWHMHVRYVPTDLPAHFHPNAAARLVWEMPSGQAVTLGYVGQLHPKVLSELGIEGAFFVADLDVVPLSAEATVARYKALPRFPGIRRDVAVIAKTNVHAGELVATALKEAKDKGMALEDVQMFDVYQGKGIADGHLSLALAFFFRHAERTLTDDEVKSEFDALVSVLKNKFSLELRD